MLNLSNTKWQSALSVLEAKLGLPRGRVCEAIARNEALALPESADDWEVSDLASVYLASIKVRGFKTNEIFEIARSADFTEVFITRPDGTLATFSAAEYLGSDREREPLPLLRALEAILRANMPSGLVESDQTDIGEISFWEADGFTGAWMALILPNAPPRIVAFGDQGMYQRSKFRSTVSVPGEALIDAMQPLIDRGVVSSPLSKSADCAPTMLH